MLFEGNYFIMEMFSMNGKKKSTLQVCSYQFKKKTDNLSHQNLFI